MTLATLEVTDFRCLEDARLDLDRRCTLLIGQNATGKTSVLEAIHVLSCGRSFRSNHLSSLIKVGRPLFRIASLVETQGSLRLALQVSAAGKEVHIGGAKTSSFAPLAAALPVLIIDPSAHKLLEEGPSRRRRYLDWGTFHVEPQFISEWRRYQRALGNRNAALKSLQSESLVRAWDEELAAAGTSIARSRNKYLEALNPYLKSVIGELLGYAGSVEYEQGWPNDTTLQEALSESWFRDTRYKSTTVGPHRGDFQIRLDGSPSKDRVSRGQQKLLACALILSQLQHRTETGEGSVCLLLDDPAAELDVDNLGKLLRIVSSIAAQLVVTAIDREGLQELPVGKMFHVKQDGIAPML